MTPEDERRIEARFERIETNLERSNERFMRIEATLDRIGERMDQFAIAHQDLEAAQLNTAKSLDRFINETRARFDEVGEKIGNLTILVDRLIARDLGA